MFSIREILIAIGVVFYILLYIFSYWKAAERMGGGTYSFSERWVVGPFMAGRLPLWVLFLAWTTPSLLLIGAHQVLKNPFWENDLAQACETSGGRWRNSGSEHALVLCPLFIDTSAYKGTPLDLGSPTLINTSGPETIGYCQCAVNHCWDETTTSCIPGSVIPTR